MSALKQLLLIFFACLGIHRVVQDVLNWVDPGFVTRDAGYFSAIAFMILYFIVKYLKQRDAAQAGTETTS